jgi:5-formyltetrahydrofolate cyclo-ligase
MIDFPQFSDRQTLRSRYLVQRSELSPADRRSLSARIAETLMTLSIFREKSRFFIYCNYHSEVETTALLIQCLTAGKVVAVPLTVPEQKHLSAVQITDPVTDLSRGYKGIPEPKPSLARQRLLNPQSLEVAIIPGAIFDRSGYRFGYGGGYYDRFLALEAPQAYRIGLAFSMQVIDSLPVATHDIPMDMLITEKEVLVWSRQDASNKGF